VIGWGSIFSFFWLVAAGRRGRDLGIGQVLTVPSRLLQSLGYCLPRLVAEVGGQSSVVTYNLAIVCFHSQPPSR